VSSTTAVGGGKRQEIRLWGNEWHETRPNALICVCLDRRLYVVHIYVQPSYVEVFGTQVVVRYQGENSVILKLLRVVETVTVPTDSTQFTIYISLQSIVRVSSLSKLYHICLRPDVSQYILSRKVEIIS